MTADRARTRPRPGREPIAIVGIGCRFPGGASNPDAFWKLLCGRVDAITEVPPDRWNISGFYHPNPAVEGTTYAKWGGFIEGIDLFEPEGFGISPREASFIDPQQRLLLEVAWEAFEDAGQPLSAISGSNTGVFIGISSSDYGSIQSSLASQRSIGVHTTTGSVPSIAANRLSYFFNLRGPSFVVDTACSSSLVATHLACRSLWSGDCEMALAGGVNVIIVPETFIAFSRMSMLSPDGRCKAFDRLANGFVRAEGAAVVMLKLLGRAVADGDPIYAVIRATGVNQDARTGGITVPSLAAQEALLRQTYAEAGIPGSRVAYVEAHGTGTAIGDPIEAEAIGRVTSEGRKSRDVCFVGSVKTNIGHLEAGSGIAGLIKTALVLKHGSIPPSLHFHDPNPHIDFTRLRLQVATSQRDLPDRAEPAVASVNSFGFGGTNAHVVLVQHHTASTRRSATRARSTEAPSLVLLPLSARSPEALTALATEYRTFLRSPAAASRADLDDICYTAAVRRTHFTHRVCLAGRDRQELDAQLGAFLAGQSQPEIAAGRRPAGGPGKVTFVFSGQGSQWWGMGRRLMKQEPIFRQAMEACDREVKRIAKWSLLEELTKSERSSRLDETWLTQPALFAIQVSLAKLWESWGVSPDAVVGHSVGEVAAARVAGALTLTDAVRVIVHRGRLMATVPGGRMLAVGSSAEEADALIQRYAGRVTIAAINGPASVTLAGDATDLDDIVSTIDPSTPLGTGAERTFCQMLPVPYAFHSAHMDPVRRPLLDALGRLTPSPVKVSMISTATGEPIDGDALDAEYWWRNVRQPVLFARAIDRAIDDGHTAFLEVAPHPVLSASIRQILARRDRSGRVLPSLGRGQDDRLTMVCSLAGLYAAGFDVNWAGLWTHPRRSVALPRHPWRRERYWHEAVEVREHRLGRPPHPLLGRARTTAFPTWETVLDRSAFSYLADHRVGDHVVFPAAAFLDIGFAVAREVFGDRPCTLEDVDFVQALFLPEGHPDPALQTVYTPSDSSFAIHSRASGGDGAWTLHVKGALREESASPSTARADVTAMVARCRQPSSTDEIYRQLQSTGMTFGPSFRGINTLWRGEREAVGLVSLDARARDDARGYRIFPSFLDACMQVVSGAIPSDHLVSESSVFLPVRVDRARLFTPPGDRVWVHAIERRLTEKAFEADVFVYDDEGALLIAVEGLTCQRVAGMRASAQDQVADWIYDVSWQEQPLAGTVAPVGVLDAAPPLSTLAERVEVAYGTDEYRESLERRALANPKVEELARAYVLDAFRALAREEKASGVVFIQGGGKTTPDPFSLLAPGRHRAAQYLLKQLVASGLITETENGLAIGENAGPTPREQFQALLAACPGDLASLSLLGRCGDRLAAILRGEVSLAEVIGSTSLLERYYADGSSFRAHNMAAACAVRALQRHVPAGRTFRVLEIGAGTGTLTAHLLAELQPGLAAYTFTDRSNDVLIAARQTFQDEGPIVFRTFDLDQDPIGQGFEAHGFDLVVASDVLHATRSIRESLNHIRRMLASNGVLLLIEPARARMATDVSVGLIDSRWNFTDGDLRDHPVLARPQWIRVLEDEGFTQVQSFPAIDAEAEHTLLLARGPAVSSSLILNMSKDERLERASARGSTRSPQAEQAAIVYACDVDAMERGSPTGETLKTFETDLYHGVIDLVQTLVKSGLPELPRLFLITRGLHPLGERQDARLIGQSLLQGMASVISNEHPELRVKLVDLPAEPNEHDLEALSAEMHAADDEDEIAIRNGVRLVPRVSRRAGRDRGEGAVLATEGPHAFRVDGESGTIRGLALRNTGRVSPPAGHVEIEVDAVSLNFRDVLKVLGLYPADEDDLSLLGDECAGIVSDVGPDVLDVRRGDAVIAILPGSLRSHVIAPAERVIPKPPLLTTHEAATLPVAFLTASYCLEHLARLAPGERVLIQAGAGGVGMAAIQVALTAGAEVFATTSASKKWLLESLGIRHVLDSRSLTFADEILALTGGRGVDVVLNSLAGDAIHRGLSALAPYGRFIEIGKRDIVSNSKLGMRAFRRNVSFHAVDLGRVMQERPAVVRTLLASIMARLQSGSPAHGAWNGPGLHPIPHCVFPVSRTAAAFRYMSQARHEGKVVISFHDPNARVVRSRDTKLALRPDATYLITGGLGGFGLRVARWMSERGARYLVLVGRSGPRLPEAVAEIERLRSARVHVVEARADVTSRDQLASVIGRAARDMPPLRGMVHAAMVLGDRLVANLDIDTFRRVTAPKMLGAWNLHELTAETELDFFVLLSSAAALVGGPGQANYAAANAFLDSLAAFRRSNGLPASSVALGAVSDVGYLARHPHVAKQLARRGIESLTADQTLAVIELALLEQPVYLAALRMNRERVAHVQAGRPIRRKLSSLVDRAASTPGDERAGAARQALAAAEPQEREALAVGYLRDHLSRVVGLPADRLDADAPLGSVGLDSLMTVELMNRIGHDLGVAMSVADFVNDPTVRRLAHAVLERFAGRVDADAHAAGMVTAPIPSSGHMREAPVPSGAEGSLVRLKDGLSKPPLFCIHGVGGGIGVYRPLARHLSSAQPVYGLSSRGVSGADEYESMDEMAAAYADLIQATQPNGPYNILGYSVGASIALAIVQTLEQAGEAVSFCGLIEPHVMARDASTRFNPRRYLPGLLRSLAAEIGLLDTPSFDILTEVTEETIAMYQRLGEDEQLRFVLEFLESRRLLSVEIDRRAFATVFRLFGKHMALLDSFSPRPVRTPLSIWTASDTLVQGATWPANRYTLGGSQEAIVEGDHYSIMYAPVVGVIAGRIDAMLSAQAPLSERSALPHYS